MIPCTHVKAECGGIYLHLRAGEMETRSPELAGQILSPNQQAQVLERHFVSEKTVESDGRHPTLTSNLQMPKHMSVSPAPMGRTTHRE